LAPRLTPLPPEFTFDLDIYLSDDAGNLVQQDCEEMKRGENFG
jgi:hypothetical protein